VIDVEPCRAVDGDDRAAPGDHRADVAVIARRDEDDPGHVLGEGDVEVARLLAGIVVGVAEHHGEAGRLGAVLHCAGQRGEERILDVGDDEGDDLGVLPTQGARGAVGGVLERFGGRTHEARLGVGDGTVVEDPGHRGGGHARECRHLVDRRHAVPIARVHPGAPGAATLSLPQAGRRRAGRPSAHLRQDLARDEIEVLEVAHVDELQVHPPCPRVR